MKDNKILYNCVCINCEKRFSADTIRSCCCDDCYDELDEKIDEKINNNNNKEYAGRYGIPAFATAKDLLKKGDGVNKFYL